METETRGDLPSDPNQALYDRIESLSAQVADWRGRLAEQCGKTLAAEAQVAELKKDAERVLYKQCSKHEGMAYTFMVTTMPYTRIICPQCDAAKESGE